MIPIVGLLAILTLSVIVVRIGSIALELTGLSPEVAAFQAQSAFSGAGFTTTESESVVSHPVRRKILRTLILFGSVGVTSSMATFILTFIRPGSTDLSTRILFLTVGLVILYFFAKSKFVYRLIKKSVIRALNKYKALQLYDYQEILGISSGYSISRMIVKKNNWMVGKALRELNLHQEGILILSVHRMVKREEKFIGVPSGDTLVESGDILTIYGNEENCKNLAGRSKGRVGDKEHEEQVEIEETRAELREKTGGFEDK